jgi:hypothetical protein
VIDPRFFYCLVDLGKDADREPPEVYVLPSAAVAEFVRRSHASWLSSPKRSGEPRKDTPMRVLQDPVPANVGELAEFPPGWLEKYRENWSLIASRVGVE